MLRIAEVEDDKEMLKIIKQHHGVEVTVLPSEEQKKMVTAALRICDEVAQKGP